jgi:hypothetical protein
MIAFQPCVDHHHNITPQNEVCGDLAISVANAWEVERPRDAPMFWSFATKSAQGRCPGQLPKKVRLPRHYCRCAPRTPDALVKFEVSISCTSPIKR